MLKFAIIILGLGLFLSSFRCSRVRADQFGWDYNQPSYLKLMDSVRLYSSPRTNNFQFDFGSRDSLHLIQPETMERYFGKNSNRVISENFTLESYENYYFFDFQEYKKWISFSIFADTESGFVQLYQFSYLKATRQITSCVRIGVYEGDGGASRIDYLEYDKSGTKLVNRSIYQYDQDIFDDEKYDDCYTRSSDSIVSNFRFYPDRVDYSVDTVRSWVDTICWKEN